MELLDFEPVVGETPLLVAPEDEQNERLLDFFVVLNSLG